MYLHSCDCCESFLSICGLCRNAFCLGRMYMDGTAVCICFYYYLLWCLQLNLFAALLTIAFPPTLHSIADVPRLASEASPPATGHSGVSSGGAGDGPKPRWMVSRLGLAWRAPASAAQEVLSVRSNPPRSACCRNFGQSAARFVRLRPGALALPSSLRGTARQNCLHPTFFRLPPFNW